MLQAQIKKNGLHPVPTSPIFIAGPCKDSSGWEASYILQYSAFSTEILAHLLVLNCRFSEPLRASYASASSVRLNSKFTAVMEGHFSRPDASTCWDGRTNKGSPTPERTGNVSWHRIWIGRGKLTSLNSSRPSKEGTFRALGNGWNWTHAGCDWTPLPPPG